MSSSFHAPIRWLAVAGLVIGLAACSEGPTSAPPPDQTPNPLTTDQVLAGAVQPGVSGPMRVSGDLHATVPLPLPGTDVSIAFDGSRIYYNRGGTELISFEPADPYGTVSSVNVGLDLDAMAWDATRGVLWSSVHSSDAIYTVDVGTGTATYRFSAAGKCVRCIGTYRDGLAFDANDPNDPNDDRIWWSRDVDSRIYEMRLDGTTTRWFDFSNATPQNYSSGIAVGGPNLYLANNGYGSIFRVDKASLTLVDQFASPGQRPEDLECDPVTYAPVEVMWVRRYENPNNVLAYEIPAGTCGVGGEPPAPDDLTPPVIVPNVVGTLGNNFWYTTDIEISWTVTDPDSPILSTSGCDATTVTSDTGDVTFTCTATSDGGTASASVTVKRDATDPTIMYDGNAGSYDISDNVAITCTPDDAMSGIYDHTCLDITGPAWSFPLGSNTFSATAEDNAGNTGGESTSLTVSPSFDGLCAVVQQLVTQHGVANSLCVKLAAAARAAERGATNAQNNVLSAFIAEVEAQTGKKVPAEGAPVLIASANALMG